MRFRFTFLAFTVLIIALLNACQSAAITPTTPLADTQTVKSTAALKTPASEQERIAATLEVPSPSNMTSGDGMLWVLSGSSILRVDPQTNQMIGDPIQPGIPMEDIAFGDGALWVTTVASGDLGAPSDGDAVSRIDVKTGKVLFTVKVPSRPHEHSVYSRSSMGGQFWHGR